MLFGVFVGAVVVVGFFCVVFVFFFFFFVFKTVALKCTLTKHRIGRKYYALLKRSNKDR